VRWLQTASSSGKSLKRGKLVFCAEGNAGGKFERRMRFSCNYLRSFDEFGIFAFSGFLSSFSSFLVYLCDRIFSIFMATFQAFPQFFFEFQHQLLSNSKLSLQLSSKSLPILPNLP
jgi:hypothetical protein